MSTESDFELANRFADSSDVEERSTILGELTRRREARSTAFVPPFILSMSASELIAEHTGRIEYQEGN